mgnify:CR=1 FL=1
MRRRNGCQYRNHHYHRNYRNTYTDFGAAYVGRMIEEDKKNPHIITHTLLLLFGLPFIIYGTESCFVFMLGTCAITFAVIGFQEDYKKIIKL